MSYFYLVYTDYNELQKQQNDVSGTITKKQSRTCPDLPNKKLIVNPDCPMQLILDYVCQEVGIDKNSDFDFATNKCVLLNIKAYKPSTSGLVAFVPKETYFLVLIERDDFENRTKIVPILNIKEYADFAAHLKRISNIKIAYKRPSSMSGIRSHSSKHISRERLNSPKVNKSSSKHSRNILK